MKKTIAMRFDDRDIHQRLYREQLARHAEGEKFVGTNPQQSLSHPHLGTVEQQIWQLIYMRRNMGCGHRWGGWRNQDEQYHGGNFPE